MLQRLGQGKEHDSFKGLEAAYRARAREGAQDETGELSGARWGGVQTLMSVHVSAYSLDVRGREGWQEDHHVQIQKTRPHELAWPGLG